MVNERNNAVEDDWVDVDSGQDDWVDVPVGGAVSEAGEPVPSDQSQAVEQPQEDKGMFASAWDAWEEMVTGAGRRAALPKDVQKLPELSETARMTDMSLLTGLMLETDAEGRKSIIENNIPGSTVRMVNDTQVVTFPNGQEAIVDRPGISPQDISTLSAQTLAYLTPAKFTGMIKGLFPRAMATGAAEGFVNSLIQKGSQLLGSEQEIDPLEVATATTLGMGGEFAPAVVGVASRKIRDVADKTALMKKVREGRVDDDTSEFILKTSPEKDPYQSELIPADKSPLDEQVEQTTDMLPSQEVDFMPQAPEGVKENVQEMAKNIPFSKEKVIRSPLADELNRQKVPPLLTTNLRETNTATRNEAKRVINTHKQAMKTGNANAYSVIGKHFSNRVNTVLDASKQAMKEQRAAVDAMSDIRGVDLDEPLNKIAFDITDSIDDTGISFSRGDIDFSGLQQGSPIRGSGEKELTKHWTDIKNARTAKDLHDVKKNIQTKLKDYYKQSGNADFDSQTEQILNRWQRSINEQLREISPQYRDANDILSKNINAIKVLEDAIPSVKKVDLSMIDPESPNLSAQELQSIQKEIDTMFGQEFRKIDTDYGKAVKIERAIDAFDDLARQYGGKYDVNVKALSRILNSYKSRVGDRSGTFQAKIQSGTEAGNREVVESLKKLGKSQFFIDQGRNVKQALDPVSEITTDNAHKAIIDYIDDVNKRVEK